MTNDLKEAVKNRLAQDKGLQVFQYYGFEPNNRKPQRENPFRQERTSSFFITWHNNKFRFKDFGDTDCYGDAWEFVKRFENTPNSLDVWQRLAEIYGIWWEGVNERMSERVNKKPLNPRLSTLSSQLSTLNSITFRDFTQEELDFWWKKGEIDLPTLQAEGVKVVQSFELAYPQPVGEARIWKKDNLKFIFAFEIVAGKVYKLYQPKELHRAFGKGKTSFLPNLAHAKEVFGEHYRYAFGLNTLKAGESAILCGGEADCLALKAKGYNAFTMGAEEAKIPPFILEKLQAKGIEAKDLQVLYDTDFTGYKHSRLLKKQYKTTVLTLPKLACQTRKDLPKPAENDLCDYVGKYGWDADLELCLAQKPFSKRGFVLPAVPQFKVEKYLKPFADHIACFFSQHTKIQLVGDAGLGKTHTLLREVAPLMPNPVLFLVPYAIQVSQIEKEYADMGHNLTCFHNKPPQENEELRFAQVNVCTYDRAKQLFDKNPDFEVWIDESHLLTQAYPYRRQAIDNILAMAEKAPRVVLLSATPDFQMVRHEKFQPIVFRRAKNPLFDIEKLAYQTKQERNALLGKLLTERTSEGVTVVRLNDKKLALSCRDALVEMGIYKAQEIDFVFSMEEKNFYTRSHLSLVQAGKIPEGVRLLFVSSCFDCGINVYNENIEHLILFETQNHDNSTDVAVQVSQRFRNLESLKTTIIKREWSRCPLDAQQAFYKREKQARNLAVWQLQNIQLAHAKHQEKIQKMLESYKKPSYLKLNTDLSKPYQTLQWNWEKRCFEINNAYLRCANEQFLQENLGIEEYYSLLEKELDIRWRGGRGEGEKSERVEEFCEKMKEAHTKRKNWLAETTENLLPQLEEQNQSMFFETLYAQSRDTNLKEHILAKTPASLHSINEQQNANPIPTSANIEGALEVGAKHTIAKRYFQLKDLLFSPTETQTLLRAHTKDTDFQALVREVGNHIKLKACEQLGEDVWLLAQDTLLREELQTLKFLQHALKNLPTASPKEQKNTAKYAQEAERAGERFVELRQAQTALEKAIDVLACEPKQKTKLASLQRKLATKNRQVERAQIAQKEIEAKLQASQISAWELNDLNQYLNAMRGQAGKMQMRVNVRLVQSLCHTQTFRRKTWDNETQTYQIKQYINIEGLKTLEDALQGFGLPAEASLAYENRLQAQIQADTARIKQALIDQNLSKNVEKVREASIVYYLQPKNIVLNENGYPADWD